MDWFEFRGNYFRKSEIVGVVQTFGGKHIKIVMQNSEASEYVSDNPKSDINQIMQKIWGTWVEDTPIKNNHLPLDPAADV